MNERADVLSKLASASGSIDTRLVVLMTSKQPSIYMDLSPTSVMIIGETNDWRTDVVKYLVDDILPADKADARRLKNKALRYSMIGSDLYKRSFGGTLMRCLDNDEAFEVMTEVHEGSCGNHSGGRALAQKITRQGYFWPTVVKDSYQFSRGCNECQ